MSPIDQALNTLLGWFYAVFAAFLSFFGLIERSLREALVELGVPERLHGAIILIAALAFIALIIRLFGGIFRILLIVFLILLILEILSPMLGI